ncbi:MAG: hypothetical protein QOJ41_351, partial [Acidobacteriaceae bacterium]|nr:hypothetical protein [Acidobacteriaceae bacterium]
SIESCLQVSVMPIVILGAILVAIAIEGIMCLLMAAPIAMFLALLGGLIGLVIQTHHWGAHHRPAMLRAILFFLPSAFFGEHAAALKPPDFVVHSAVEINAPPRSSLAPCDCLRRDPAASRIIISRRHRLSHPRRNFTLGSRRHPPLHLLHRRI